MVKVNATSELFLNCHHSSIQDIIEYIGINQGQNKDESYARVVLRACDTKLKQIKQIESLMKEDETVKAIRYLLNNRKN